MKILLTGDEGYVGSGLTRYLRQAHEVDEDGLHVRVERAAQERDQLREDGALRVGVVRRAPSVCERADPAPAGGDERGGVGGREERAAERGLVARDALEHLSFFN